MPQRPRSALRLAAITAAAAALLAACSSSGGASGTGPNGTSQPSASNLKGDPIRIGVIADVTGPAASSFQWAAPTAQAWAKWVNATGGINQHPVQVYIADAKGDPSTAQQQVAELVEKDKVIAFVGVGSSTDPSWGPYLQQHNVPVIGGTGDSDVWNTNPMYFSTSGTASHYHPLDAVAAKTLGASSMALVVCAEVAACSQAETIVKPVAAQLGIRFDGTLKVATTSPNYTAQCLTLKQHNTGLVFALIARASVAKLIQNCAQQGYNPLYGVAGTTFGADLGAGTTAKIIGNVQGFPWWIDEPQVVEYRNEMTKYGAADDYAYPQATESWAALQLFRSAMASISSTGTPTSADVLNGLYALKPTNVNGLLPTTISYHEGAPAAQAKKWCSYFVTIQAGKLAAPNGLTPTCPS